MLYEQNNGKLISEVRINGVTPFLTVSLSKGQRKRNGRCAPFVSPDDTRLDDAEEIANWLQHDWYANAVHSHPQATQNNFIIDDDDDDDEDLDDAAEVSELNLMLGSLLGVNTEAAMNTDFGDQNEDDDPSGTPSTADNSANERSTTTATILAIPNTQKKKVRRNVVPDGLTPETFFTFAHTIRGLDECIR
ncbi:hypothetical protein SARC_09194 [Sphaeroforma arctica JP610]|uniref:Uncharacterized protein n=1 Tax=Sphaeroforma arctica JP610 TaxID=667725 RepID=A0A0L0FNI8_9EUKA|nr:hypothetical protein SARC_09194 [Sphaeroforma arctica JP610]KNC78372.1 hypothetical protein SARC_09194 [Sphaeroforma arctica JP610]|eukprot:XP_014152274.1 hypothetical protein SARC_09194 [Sphaeroforma arctica JP610]